jgi:hypothetical protein
MNCCLRIYWYGLLLRYVGARKAFDVLGGGMDKVYREWGCSDLMME